MNRKESKKILLADSDRKLHQCIKQDAKTKQYHFEFAASGTEALKKMQYFQPDLVVMELMLPHIHGIEILKRIRTDSFGKQIGVILLEDQVMIQDYQAALRNGCDYLLEKPFSLTSFFSILSRFFKGDLTPLPFKNKEISASHAYLPKAHSNRSYLKFWGTRGSNAVSGSSYVHFGGNTCCLELRHGKNLLIIDAGNGIRPLGLHLAQTASIKDIHLLISHTHWDHVSGFPFFAPLYDPSYRIHIWAPIGFDKTIHDLFAEMLVHSLFPVNLEEIKAQLIFKNIYERIPFQIGSFEIDTHYALHPGATLCFKITCAKTTFGYATDNEFLMGYHGKPQAITSSHSLLQKYLSLISFFKGCNFLIHEAQYTPSEYQHKVGWGHSSVANASVLIKHTDTSHWIVTHHDPMHTDENLLHKIQLHRDVLIDCNMDCHFEMAFDGLLLPF